MEEEYNFYDEDVNKTNVIKVVIILILIGLVGLGYFGYKKYDERKQKKEETPTVSVTDPEIQKLYQQYNIFTTSIGDHSLFLQDELFGYYYRADAYTNQTISNEAKLVTALNALFLNQTIPYEEGSTEPFNVEGKVVRDMVEQLFGEKVLYKDGGIDKEQAVFCQFGEITYDEEKDMYQTEGEGSCAGSNRPIIKTKLISAEKLDREITITEEMAYLVPEQDAEHQINYKIYDSMEETDESFVSTIHTQSEFAFYNYKHLHRYQYHFTKKGQTYYLSKVERIK